MRHRAEPAGDPADDPPERSPRARLRIGAVVVLLVGALVVAVAVSALAQGGGEVPITPPTGAALALPTATDAPSGGAEVLIHVLGAVRTPGLVSLRPGARVVDAVAAAGGLADGADPGAINLARVVTDGEQLYVPKTGEVPPPAAGAPGGAAAAGGGSSGGLINLNAAGASELETLPRIGPALAQRILDWRQSNGRFSTVDDLRKVTGIGDKLFDGLKDLVTV